MSWKAGDVHFLVSDTSNHLASGRHAHGGTTHLNERKEVHKGLAQIEDETLLMGFVKEYLKQVI